MFHLHYSVLLRLEILGFIFNKTILSRKNYLSVIRVLIKYEQKTAIFCQKAVERHNLGVKNKILHSRLLNFLKKVLEFFRD